MAAAEPAIAGKKPFMAASAVPTGAAPIVPTYVAPAQIYEEDEDEVEEIMRPKPAPLQQAAPGLSLGLIFGLVLLVITLSAVATFFALDVVMTSTAVAPVTPAPFTPKQPDATTRNESLPTDAPLPSVKAALDFLEEDATTESAAEGTPRSEPRG